MEPSADRRTRRRFLRGGLALAGLGLFTGCGVLPLPARQPAKMPRIGFLALGAAGSAGAVSLPALVDGLRDLGYLEGQNIAIEPRYAEGRDERVPDLAAELVGLAPDVIVTAGTVASLAVKHATETIPTVSVSGSPVETGLVAGLARPGGNVTGLTLEIEGLGGKWLELLIEAAPHAARAAVLQHGDGPGARRALREVQDAAQKLGVQALSLNVRGPDEYDAAFAAAAAGRAEALIVDNSPIHFARRSRVVGLAASGRLPAMYPQREFVQDGGLMMYGATLPDVFRRAATYVDKILKGAKPADLPVEQPTRFDFVVNLKTAQALGLAIPPSVLQQATEVIQ